MVLPEGVQESLVHFLEMGTEVIPLIIRTQVTFQLGNMFEQDHRPYLRSGILDKSGDNVIYQFIPA